MLRWRNETLEPLEYCEPGAAPLLVADSWLVDEGRALALDLHRDRFRSALPTDRVSEFDAFWSASLSAIPAAGALFPRIEYRSSGFTLVLREAPPRKRTAVLASWTGPDPRTVPETKGPDLEAMLRIRTAVQPLGADEAVILSDDGYVVEGAYSALLWWRGDILCGPPAEFARIDSVTARTVQTLAAALGLDTYEEAVTPTELDGTELWALSALHGPRIVTSWVDGPALAERPGRLATWRKRLDVLRRPLTAG